MYHKVHLKSSGSKLGSISEVAQFLFQSVSISVCCHRATAIGPYRAGQNFYEPSTKVNIWVRIGRLVMQLTGAGKSNS
jgi:hypothetical protein